MKERKQPFMETAYFSAPNHNSHPRFSKHNPLFTVLWSHMCTPWKGHSTFFQVGVCGKNLAKNEAAKAKYFLFFFSKGGLVNWLWSAVAWNGTLANYGRGVKRGSSWLHIPIPRFLGQCPRGVHIANFLGATTYFIGHVLNQTNELGM